MRTIVMLITTVSILFIGCQSLEIDDLYGEYIVEYPFATEKLVINSNGTYEQSIDIYDLDTLISHKGKWELSLKYNDVMLYDGISITNGFCELDSNYFTPVNGYLLCSAIKYFPWSQIKLSTGCEGLYFEKIK